MIKPMPASPLKIQIDMADKRFVGDERCEEWTESDRQVPADFAPFYLGVAEDNHVPFDDHRVKWDFIFLSIEGFGVAVNHESVRNQNDHGGGILANVFITTDHARHWLKNPMRLSWCSRVGAWFSWPVEQYQNLVATANATVVLAWEDPWIMERSRSHIIFSNNCGLKWHYRSLKKCNPYLYTTPSGQIMCFGNRTRRYSQDGGRHWQSEAFGFDFDDGNTDIVFSNIQNATFFSEEQGFALLAKFNQAVALSRPETILLLKTNSSGSRWRRVAEFPFPKECVSSDPKHILGLAVS
jgi:hypothetical protein